MRLSYIAAFLFVAPVLAAKPNIVVILADDLGYGDVRCLNPDGKIPTPHMDRVAAAGRTFTDAHTPSAVCSPTRYGLMTGRYAWRTPLQSGVLGGLSPRLIEPGRETLASRLKSVGYATAAVGKWHLGFDWALKPGTGVNRLNIETREQVFNVEYDKPIAGGPTAVGFDHYFGIAASLDMVPYAFIRNDRLTASPTDDRDFAMKPAAKARTRKGPAAPGFEAVDVLPTLVTEAVRVIGERATQRDTPFFLYLPLTTPHTPIAPAKAWEGKSGLGPYGDFVMQTDAAVGAVLDALDAHKLANDTLVLVTSDNGCSPQADFPALAKLGHNPSGPFRGTKADVYEGGHRVPFLVRWPGVVQPGTRTDQLVCLTDVFRTCCEIAGATVTGGEDSVSFLPTLRGVGGGRTTLVSHSINGSFAIRDGSWKLCLCAGSGGWSEPKPGTAGNDKLPPVQLFDLSDDVGERRNRAAEQPERVAALTKLLDTVVASHPNAVPVTIRKPTPTTNAKAKAKGLPAY